MSEWTSDFKHPIDYLLTEDVTESFLLLETGDQIVLDQTGNAASLWSNPIKN